VITMDATISKEGLDTLFSKLGYDILVPVRKDTVVSFVKVDNAGDIAWDYMNTVTPPKKAFLPQTEVMYTFDAESINDMTPTPERRLIFGIRPCDARSLTILDLVFTGDVKDPYYGNRRENTIIAGMACNHPGSNCFCTSLGAGPFDTKGLDIMMVDLGDKLLFRTITDRGRDFIQEHGTLFASGTDEADRIEGLKQKAEATISRQVETGDLPGKLKKLFDDPIWDRMCQTCLGCYVCTYLCPTCHCFDIQDEMMGDKGQRIRIWDSCANPEYTLHASGYNPRPGRKNRMRNRILHKYQYHPENYNGQILCGGCGRCIDHCPVNNDLVEELKMLGGI